MHYLIDGHNLIGRMPDIFLDDPDDEVELVLRLRSWAARSRKRRVTVIFDRGLPGGKDRGLSTGKVQVVFASAGKSADSLLRRRILGAKNPGEFTLVSSDLQIIKSAEKRRMPYWRSEEFVARMGGGGDQKQGGSGSDEAIETAEKPQPDPTDINMWLDLFSDEEGSQ